MIPRKFIAATSREALYKVREALGDEAIILSNKQVPGGVEIIAVSEHEMDAFAHEAHAQNDEHASFSAPQWPRYPEPRIGAAAHYQHWQNVSWNPEADEAPWATEESSARVSEPLSSLNHYWHGQSQSSPSASSAELPSWMSRSTSESPSGKSSQPAFKESVSMSAHANGEHPSRQIPAGSSQSSHSGHRSPLERSSTPPARKPPVSSASRDDRAARGGGRPLPSSPPTSLSGQGKLSGGGAQSSASGSSKSFSTSARAVSAGGNSQVRASRSGSTDEAAIQHELKLLRSMLEGQLAGFAWNELSQRTPLHLTLMRWLLSAGISPALARETLEQLSSTQDIMEAMGRIRQCLSQQIDCMPETEDIIDKGGVYALVGTTGVGKTTTVAKLAARCTLKHGPQHVALLTTDSYRIGAHDQLKAYGRILSVPVYGVRDESDLMSALSDLSTRRLILIDTIGMSQRDRRLVEQIALLGRQGGRVQQLLLIAANAQASTLEDVVRAYGSSQLAGIVISKLDETAQIGSVLDMLIRHRLRVCYLTDGQRVPEDLHLPDPRTLVDRAFQDILSESPLTLAEDEYPLIWK